MWERSDASSAGVSPFNCACTKATSVRLSCGENCPADIAFSARSSVWTSVSVIDPAPTSASSRSL